MQHQLILVYGVTLKKFIVDTQNYEIFILMLSLDHKIVQLTLSYL